MDQVTPAISVVMPVFNRAAVVRRAIDSVLAQSFADFELIVVDDGSSDASAEVIAAVDDPRLRFIRLPANAGGNAARNRGIREARAPLIAFLDSDDYFLTDKLDFVVAYFAEHPQIDALIDSFIKTYPPEQGRPDTPRPNPVIDNSAGLLAALFTRRIWKATPGISARRDAILRAGLFDEQLRRRQDYDFIVRLAENARCASTDRLTWIKTNSPDAISANLDTHLDAIVDFYRRHPHYYSNAAFREGLALDLARHFNRAVSRRKLGRIPRDAASLVRLFGPARFLALAGQGYRLLRARKRRLAAEAPRIR